jgi:hypothetical protein
MFFFFQFWPHLPLVSKFYLPFLHCLLPIFTSPHYPMHSNHLHFLFLFLSSYIYFLKILFIHFLLYFFPSSSHVFPLIFLIFFIVEAYFLPICAYCMNDQKIGHHFMFLMLILHNMPKKTNKHFMGLIQILQLWTKTNAYCWITCKDCMLNAQDLMHILWWLSCKYYNQNHIAHAVFLKMQVSH